MLLDCQEWAERQFSLPAARRGSRRAARKRFGEDGGNGGHGGVAAPKRRIERCMFTPHSALQDQRRVQRPKKAPRRLEKAAYDPVSLPSGRPPHTGRKRVRLPPSFQTISQFLCFPLLPCFSGSAQLDIPSTQRNSSILGFATTTCCNAATEEMDNPLSFFPIIVAIVVIVLSFSWFARRRSVDSTPPTPRRGAGLTQVYPDVEGTRGSDSTEKLTVE